MNLLELYCHVDGFVKFFLPEWNKHLLDENKKKRNRLSRLTPSEIITILVHFHQSQYRNFKSFYLLHVCQHLRSEFPDLLSYNRFIALVPTVFAPLCAYLQSQKANFDGIGFVDSTPIFKFLSCQHAFSWYIPKEFMGIKYLKV
jgi:hypothetical protein